MPKGTFDVLALGFALSDFERVQELARPYLERQRAREDALLTMHGRFAGFSGPGSALMTGHLAAALDERLARLGLGADGTRQATRVVEALDLQLSSASVSPGPEALAVIAGVREAGNAMRAIVEASDGRVRTAGEIRSGQVDRALGNVTTETVADLRDYERFLKAFARADAAAAAPPRRPDVTHEAPEGGPYWGKDKGRGRVGSDAKAPSGGESPFREWWRDTPPGKSPPGKPAPGREPPRKEPLGKASPFREWWRDGDGSPV